MYTHLEDFIYQLYTSIGVRTPSDLDMNLIAGKMGIEITYKEDKTFRCDNEIILKKGTESQEWTEFAHEIAHYLRHCGNQLIMHPLFRQLQEYQADYFAYHFCVPTFMLDKLINYTVYDIINLFNVDYKFALRRLEMYQSKIIMKGEPSWLKVMQETEVTIDGN